MTYVCVSSTPTAPRAGSRCPGDAVSRRSRSTGPISTAHADRETRHWRSPAADGWTSRSRFRVARLDLARRHRGQPRAERARCLAPRRRADRRVRSGRLTASRRRRRSMRPAASDRRFELTIGRRPGFLDGRPGLQWTINGRIFPHVPVFVVEEGDLVRVTIANDTDAVHPMHLHGHHLLVLSRDGVPVSGSPWWADTLNVEAGERYDVAFRADNPGHLDGSLPQPAACGRRAHDARSVHRRNDSLQDRRHHPQRAGITVPRRRKPDSAGRAGAATRPTRSIPRARRARAH